MPYNDGDFRSLPGDAVKGKALAWKGHIKRIWYIPRHCRLRVLQVFLSRGRPVIISMYAHDDFQNFRAPSRTEAVYRPRPGQSVTSTARITGTRSVSSDSTTAREGGCFILVNSWGKEWGYWGVAYLRVLGLLELRLTRLFGRVARFLFTRSLRRSSARPSPTAVGDVRPRGRPVARVGPTHRGRRE